MTDSISESNTIKLFSQPGAVQKNFPDLGKENPCNKSVFNKQCLPKAQALSWQFDNQLKNVSGERPRVRVWALKTGS